MYLVFDVDHNEMSDVNGALDPPPLLRVKKYIVCLGIDCTFDKYSYYDPYELFCGWKIFCLCMYLHYNLLPIG